MKDVSDILDELDDRYENKDWSINEAMELAIEETSKYYQEQLRIQQEIYQGELKTKDEEFIKILTKLEDDMDALQINYANLDECKKVDVYELIEEVKQKI